MTPLGLLQVYRYQAFIGKRHERRKTGAQVMPVNYNSPERIKAFPFPYLLAVTIHALIERDVRVAM